MKLRDSLLFVLSTIVALTLFATHVKANEKISFIRDAEIENTIRTYAKPLFLAAGLEPENIRIYLVEDRQLNAFVSGGPNIFLNVGLLMQSKSSGELIGVIAHEIAHITGGHLSRTRDALQSTSNQIILGYVLGTAAAVATGRADLGAAIVGGSYQTGARSFFAYSRTQESSADQAATKLLDQTGQSTRPFLMFMETLLDQELLPTLRQDPYIRTHPITIDRIRYLRSHVKISPLSDKPEPPEWTKLHKRMVAKLHGFLSPFRQTLRRYRETDISLVARYARAIAYYKHPDLKQALILIDQLIAEQPKDPYFLELKGQILYENGHIVESLKSYEKAVHFLPDNALLRTALAQARLATEKPTQTAAAIKDLRIALRSEPKSISLWRKISIAYGRNKQLAKAYLAQAEAAYLENDKSKATFYAEKASRLFKKDSPEWLHAQDILLASKKNNKHEKNR